MPYREQIAQTPSSLADFSWYRKGTAWNGTSRVNWDGTSEVSASGTYLVPSFRSHYSIITDQKKTHKEDWHSFSHYKKDCTKESLVRARVLTGQYDAGYPPDHFLYSVWVQQADIPASSMFDGYFGPADAPFVGTPPLFEIVDGELYIPPPDNLEQLLTNAAMRLLPGIKSDLSLVNSIIELKDFESLDATNAHLKDSLARILDWNRRFSSTLSWGELARRGSDAYLQYKFNIAPFLKDIEGVKKSFKAYQAQARRLVEQQAKRRTKHFIVSIPYTDAPGVEDEDAAHSYDVTFGNNTVTLHPKSSRFMQFSPAQFHVEIEYSYYFTPFQVRHAELLAFLDKMGVNFNPAIVWNALRWSFVIDWVIGVSQYLERYKWRALEPLVVIHRSLWSIKRDRSTSTSVSINGQERVPASFVKETAYRRQLYQVTPASIASSGLSPTEISLGAALIGARR